MSEQLATNGVAVEVVTPHAQFARDEGVAEDVLERQGGDGAVTNSDSN